MQNFSTEEQGLHNRDLVNHLVHNHITKLFKANLVAIESLRGKTVSQEDVDRIRKTILDTGNDAIREISGLIGVFDFYINPDRLAAASQSKKTVKKVVVSGAAEVK